MRVNLLTGVSLCMAALLAAPAAVAAPPVLLTATGVDGMHKKEPACMVSFQTRNQGTLPLVMFSGDVLPVRASDGQALETVSLAKVGVAGLSHEHPLVPGSEGKVWKLNMKNTRCDQVQIRFGKFMCSFAGQGCGAIAVEHKGLAGIAPPDLSK